MPILDIRLQRHCTITLGQLDDDKAAEVAAAFAEAEKNRQGLVLAEHKGMQVIEVNGITTGRIRAELRIFPIADPADWLRSFKTSPPDGLTLIAVIPPGAVAKGSLVAGTEAAV